MDKVALWFLISMSPHRINRDNTFADINSSEKTRDSSDFIAFFLSQNLSNTQLVLAIISRFQFLQAGRQRQETEW